MALSTSAQFWFYLTPLVPSALCSIFVLYHLLMQRALRMAANNHVVILMVSFGLIYEVTDMAWYIHFFRTGTPLSATPTFCRIWVFIDAAVYVIIAILMSWASIERHILIFHPNWIATKTKRFLVHYLPLLVCCAYPTLFYGLLFIVLPCSSPFDYTVATCNHYSCVSSDPWVGVWDSVVNFILPVFVIVVFSVALLARVLYHKYRALGRIEWRNYRKMAVQLLSISAIYFVFLLPPMLLYAAYTAGVSWDVGADYYSVSNFFGYYVVLLTPFVCVISLPELQSKCRQLFLLGRKRSVGPNSVTLHHTKATQIATLAAIKY